MPIPALILGGLSIAEKLFTSFGEAHRFSSFLTDAGGPNDVWLNQVRKPLGDWLNDLIASDSDTVEDQQDYQLAVTKEALNYTDYLSQFPKEPAAIRARQETLNWLYNVEIPHVEGRIQILTVKNRHRVMTTEQTIEAGLTKIFGPATESLTGNGALIPLVVGGIFVALVLFLTSRKKG